MKTSRTLFRWMSTSAALVMGGLAGSAFAQTTVTPIYTTVPGTPVTALGGAAGTNFIIILFSLSLLAIGLMIAWKDRALQ